MDNFFHKNNEILLGNILISKEIKEMFEIYRSDMKNQNSQLFLSEIASKGLDIKEIKFINTIYNWFGEKRLILYPDTQFGGKSLINKNRDLSRIFKKYLKEFENAINDDLDMPKAIAVLWKLVRDKKAVGKLRTIKKMDEVFGLDLLKKEKIEIPEKIKKLAEERKKARKEKDWKKADKLREEIKKMGWKIEDVGSDYKLQKCS